MTKGTPSHGKKMHPLHYKCRRCGSLSYHKKRGICSSCGYGRTARMRSYSWQKK